jgi:hypothetical protein
MDWEMAKNTSRRNVIRHDDPSTPRNHMNKPYCMSFIFGRNMKDPDGSMSYWSLKYPKVYSELRDLMARYDRDFGYTHITLNRNLRCKRHTDGGNAGPSYIAGFGDYRGGGLLVEPPGGGGSSDETTVLDLRGRFVTFNGKTQPHETLAFEGERFTLVYYTSDIKSGGGGARGRRRERSRIVVAGAPPRRRRKASARTWRRNSTRSRRGSGRRNEGGGATKRHKGKCGMCTTRA